jgi:hypothetical protein
MWYSDFYNDYLDHQYVSLAIQHFLLARFGSQFPFNPASGSLYHLSFELLLKSYLIKHGYSYEELKREYRHKLVLLWNVFKKEVKNGDLDKYNLVVKNLDAWDRVRYISLDKSKNASEIAISKGHADTAYLKEVQKTNFHSQSRFVIHTDDMDELFFMFFSTLKIPSEELLKVPDFVWGREIYEQDNKFNLITNNNA